MTEGWDQLDAKDVYDYRVISLLKKALPDVTITYQNFGLGSRQLFQAVSGAYVGLASEPPNPADGFYRSWSTVGKSWKDHIKDYEPDLVVVAFGMNDTFGSNAEESEYSNLSTLTAELESWYKVPSIVVIPTMLPTKNTTRYSQTQIATQRVARATRAFGKAEGLAIADVNRLYNIVVSGKDDVSRESYRESDFEGYTNSTVWTGDKSSYNLTGSTLSPVGTPSNKFVTRARNFYNGNIEVDYTPTSTGSSGTTAWINYRSDDTYGKMTVFVVAGNSSDGTIGLYTSDSTTPIFNATGLAIPTGSASNIKIVVEDTRHQVYLNDTLVIDQTVTKKLHDGYIQLGSQQSLPTYSNLVLTYSDSLQTSPMYMEDVVLGPPNDTTESGNGINHPSALGYAMIYEPAFYGIVKSIAEAPLNTVFIPRRLTTSGWGVSGSGGYPATTTTGKNLYYQVINPARTKFGIAARRLDTNAYMALSTAAISKATLASLEDGKYAYFRSPDSPGDDLLFVSDTSTPSYEIELYRYETQP